MTDFTHITRRADGSYVVKGPHGPYHVPNDGEFVEKWKQVHAYALEHPEDVFPETGEPEPTEEEFAAAELAQAKAERAAAVDALTVEVDGLIFDADEKAQERMARAVLMAESPEEQTEWVLHDDSVAIVTVEQLRRACRAAGKAMGELWVKPYQN